MGAPPKKDRLWFHEAPIPDVIIMTFIENSSVLTKDNKGPQEYPYQWI